MLLRKTYLVIGVIFFNCLYLCSQSSFIHINNQKLDTSATDFYGETLKDMVKSQFIKKETFLNYNPAIYFDGSADYLEIEKPITDLSQVTVYTVFKTENDPIAESEVWGIHAEETTLGLTTRKAFGGKKETYYDIPDKGKTVMHTFMQLYRSNQSFPNQKTFISMGVTNKNTSNVHFKGSIAELIVYKKRLRGTTRLKIESSLAIKYGITLSSGENYFSSNKKVIWDSEEDSVFSNNIAGIGRDDEMELYQKQSTSANEDEFLVLSATQKANSNAENLSELANRNFLVWGDNGEDLKLETSNYDGKPALMNRRWLLKATGPKANEIKTQLQVNANLLFDGLKKQNDYLLVIDESGTGDFLPENTRYIQSSSLTPEGILIFDNLNWDIDNSGKDVFTITHKTPLMAELSSTSPIICPNSLTNVKYVVEGGIPPYQYDLVSETGYSRQWSSDEDMEMNATITDISSGNYTLTVADLTGDVLITNYKIEETPEINIDLGPDKTLKFEQTLELQAQFSHSETISSYNWTNEAGYLSTNATTVISEPGLYTLTITTEKGCEFSESVFVNESFVREFELYPNPSQNGKFSIDIELAARQNVKVSVFNVTGVLISDFEVKNKQKATIKANKPLRQSGIYDIILQTPEETVSKKLIVE